jgi:hypothetical protein
MKKFISPRLRKPALTILAGALLAGAWVIHGGAHWWLWVSLIAIGTIVRAFSFWAWAGEDDDVAALAGSRADERQKQISLRSRALAFNVTALAAFAGLLAAVALRAGWWWPFAAILAILGFGYLLGLSNYGIAEEGTPDDDDVDTGHKARSPVSS